MSEHGTPPPSWLERRLYARADRRHPNADDRGTLRRWLRVRRQTRGFRVAVTQPTRKEQT
jgi:hypothetical protein